MPKYRVIDQLHVSSLGPDTMGKGTVFAASKAVGDDLVNAGHVELVDDAADQPAEAPEEKSESPPSNKAEPISARKIKTK